MPAWFAFVPSYEGLHLLDFLDKMSGVLQNA